MGVKTATDIYVVTLFKRDAERGWPPIGSQTFLDEAKAKDCFEQVKQCIIEEAGGISLFDYMEQEPNYFVFGGYRLSLSNKMTYDNEPFDKEWWLFE